MNLKDALEYLIGVGQSRIKILDVFKDEEFEIKLVNGEMHTFKRPVSLSHSFDTINGFVKYVESDVSHTSEGICFVNRDEIQADLCHNENRTNKAFCALHESEEFIALSSLFKPTTQKDLWRALVTDLYECVPSGFAALISQISIKAKNEATISIQPSGVTSGSKSQGTVVEFRDPKNGVFTAQIPEEIEFTGKLFKAWDEKYVIPLRIEVNADSGLTFTLHPRTLSEVLQTALGDITNHLNGHLSIPVFEGRV